MIVSGSKSIQVSCKVKSLNQFMTAKSCKRYMKYLGVNSFKDQRVKAVALVADWWKKSVTCIFCCSKLMNIFQVRPLQNEFFSYLSIERWNAYQLFEQINQPLNLQYNCTAVLDYYPKAMVKIDHTLTLYCIFHETVFPCIVLKLLQISIINLFSHQSFNYLFKQKPSRRQ